MKLSFACVLLLVGALCGQSQRVEQWELRPAADGLRLYAKIGGEDRLISNRATAAWDGWLPQTLIYAERVAPGESLQRLRWYDAFTRNSHTISTGESLDYSLVSTARLSNGQYALLITLRDPEARIPYVEIALPQTGVFLRESHAAFGVAAADFVQILRYAPADVDAKRGDLALLSPTATSRVPLLAPKFTDGAGVYEAVLDAERTATLNLRSGGQALLVVSAEGKGQPAAVRGTWTQQGAEIRVVGENGKTLTWVVGAF
ncbi:MAG TPA: hypothetical protein VES20_21005, partial [Bryobacteraceae bacterium]|nr:hypothetical protein [Bryobacteraceae bacterium]